MHSWGDSSNTMAGLLMQLLILRVFLLAWRLVLLRFCSPRFSMSRACSFCPGLYSCSRSRWQAALLPSNMMLPKKPIELISAVYFGLVVGIFLTYVLMLMLTPLLPNVEEGHWAVIFRQSVPLDDRHGRLLFVRQPADSNQG